jgi:signal transduction histidine kinase
LPPKQDADREWLRIALHDGLGQLLTSISFLAGSLQQKLAAQKLPEATQADEIVLLTGRAIFETQALAEGHESRPRTP